MKRVRFLVAGIAGITLLAVFAGGGVVWWGCQPFPPCTGLGPAVCQQLRDQEALDAAFERAGWSRRCHGELAVDYLRGPTDRTWLDENLVACAERDAAACTVVAKAYAHGCRITPDRDYARTLFDWACAAGDLDACYAWDRVSDEPSDESRFNPQIQRILDARCAQDDARACIDLASLVWNGYRDTPRSTTRTLALLKGPCDSGHAQACDKLAFYCGLVGEAEGAAEGFCTR